MGSVADTAHADLFEQLLSAEANDQRAVDGSSSNGRDNDDSRQFDGLEFDAGRETTAAASASTTVNEVNANIIDEISNMLRFLAAASALLPARVRNVEAKTASSLSSSFSVAAADVCRHFDRFHECGVRALRFWRRHAREFALFDDGSAGGSGVDTDTLESEEDDGGSTYNSARGSHSLPHPAPSSSSFLRPSHIRSPADRHALVGAYQAAMRDFERTPEMSVAHTRSLLLDLVGVDSEALAERMCGAWRRIAGAELTDDNDDQGSSDGAGRGNADGNANVSVNSNGNVDCGCGGSGFASPFEAYLHVATAVFRGTLAQRWAAFLMLAAADAAAISESSVPTLSATSSQQKKKQPFASRGWMQLSISKYDFSTIISLTFPPIVYSSVSGTTSLQSHPSDRTRTVSSNC